MQNKNCPNCGAPYDIHENQCPYCNTSYFDLTAINFTDHKPVYLKLKTDLGIITTKVIPSLNCINISDDTIDVTNKHGNAIHKFRNNRNMDIDVTFTSVIDRKGNSLFTLQIEK